MPIHSNPSVFPAYDSFYGVAPGDFVEASHVNLLSGAVMKVQAKAANGLVFTNKKISDYSQDDKQHVYCGSTYLREPFIESAGNITNATATVNVYLTKHSGEILEGVWVKKDWAIHIEVYQVSYSLTRLPWLQDGDSLGVDSTYKMTPVPWYIESYDSNNTSAFIKVRRDTTLPADAIFVSWTAVSHAELASGSGAISLAQLTPNLAGANTSVMGTTYANGVQPDSTGAITTANSPYVRARRSPNYGLTSTDPLYTNDWENYRWATTIIPVNNSVTPRRLVTAGALFVTPDYGASFTRAITGYAGEQLEVDASGSMFIRVAFDYRMGAQALAALALAGKDKFYGYVHLHWFSSAWTALGVEHSRIVPQTRIDYGSSFATRSTAGSYEPYLLEVVPPAGAAHFIFTIMCMHDDPQPSVPGHTILSFTNLNITLWNRQVIDY